jgi:hypothetical protein
MSLDNVIEFLSSLFEKGLGYSSINTARSALSALGLKFDSILVGQHPLIISYLRGVELELHLSKQVASLTSTLDLLSL